MNRRILRTGCLTILAALACVCMTTVGNAETLRIDFNSTSQDGGPHNQAGYQAYDAAHEVAADFVTQNYAAFGTTVSLTPAWPNTTDNRVMQSIDRGAGNDVNWDDTAGDLNLVTDFLGTDTRTGNGGNGDWDGTIGTPTYMTLTLGGLEAMEYDWTSFHADTENVHGYFSVELSTDGGVNFTQLADGYMSDASPGGNPDSTIAPYPGLVIGPDVTTVMSTYNTSFTANGTDDVVLRFAPYSNTQVHRQIWGISGFELAEVPEPSTIVLLLVGAVAIVVARRRRVA
ncbi:MAG: PEP-CTERM sorting domain-containing protein [Candidatus Nealsonbacteria bacterium]|nr:PEP-CTERM sorting domain-containing protein [Candidatus Nealsonbacteria bacterium]